MKLFPKEQSLLEQESSVSKKRKSFPRLSSPETVSGSVLIELLRIERDFSLIIVGDFGGQG